MNKKSENIPTVRITEVFDFYPTQDEEKKMLEFVEQAEIGIVTKKQTANVNFRWSEFEIKRAKRIAKKWKMPVLTNGKYSLALNSLEKWQEVLAILKKYKNG